MRKFIGALALYLSGCAYFVSWDELGRSWVGDPISRIIESWGEPDQKWTRADGSSVYKYQLKKLDPTCVHYWVVDDRRIIVNFYYEGNCQPIG